ncbi:MAG TPA: universal stress protein [Steroidobacteraceae bacterium]|nr:universal stress protein [Steroidobacteraceae bacterium]
MAGYQKLLLLLDLTDGSEQVARAAQRIAGFSNAEILALHVVEFVPIDPMGESLMPSTEIEQELIRRAEERLAALTQRLGLERTTRKVAAGNTKAEILRAAEEAKADLIVLGSRERHGLAILVNFTEDTILHAAHCDVLAIRLK